MIYSLLTNLKYDFSDNILLKGTVQTEYWNVWQIKMLKNTE